MQETSGGVEETYIHKVHDVVEGALEDGKCLRLVVHALRLEPDRRGQELVGKRFVREESSNLLNIASIESVTEGVDSFELGFSREDWGSVD